MRCSIGTYTLARLNTSLESAGAEFLVLGHLLIEGIQAFTAYTNFPGDGIIATHPEKTAPVAFRSRAGVRRISMKEDREWWREGTRDEGDSHFEGVRTGQSITVACCGMAR